MIGGGEREGQRGISEEKKEGYLYIKAAVTITASPKALTVNQEVRGEVKTHLFFILIRSSFVY